MKQIVDMRLSTEEKRVLAGMIGKTFEKYRCDEFLFRPAVYQLVGIFVDGQVFSIENIDRPIDYYGSIEDVGVLSVKAATEQSIYSRVEGGKQVDTSIEQVIQDVKVVDDTHIMFDGAEEKYEFTYTKAIVFVLSDRQVVLEKDVWLSEDIFVYRGFDAEGKIMAVETELEESDEFEFRAERETTSLTTLQSE